MAGPLVLKYLVIHYSGCFCEECFRTRATFKSSDFWVRWLLSIVWVGLIQTAEGLYRTKRLISLKQEKILSKTAFGLLLQQQFSLFFLIAIFWPSDSDGNVESPESLACQPTLQSLALLAYTIMWANSLQQISVCVCVCVVYPLGVLWLSWVSKFLIFI